jgi:thiamine-phosphate pyrophosphorylase
MKLVVITQSKTSENEISALTKMLEAGLDTLHVRKPHFSTKELEEFINEIPAHFHNRLIIHSHHRLALKYNLKGFHFTDTHLKRKWKLWWNTKLIYIRKPQLLKTISFKRIDSIYKPEEVATNYCFIGTMFHTISGELYSGFYKEQVEAANKKSGKNIIARGGVNERSIELANELGFYGVALYGHLWKSDQPFQKYIDFVRYCKEKNILIE